MLKILFLFIPFIVFAGSDTDEIKALGALGEQMEGCPNGCECIIDASRENRARRKLGEYEEDSKGRQEETRDLKTKDI